MLHKPGKQRQKILRSMHSFLYLNFAIYDRVLECSRSRVTNNSYLLCRQRNDSRLQHLCWVTSIKHFCSFKKTCYKQWLCERIMKGHTYYIIIWWANGDISNSNILSFPWWPVPFHVSFTLTESGSVICTLCYTLTLAWLGQLQESWLPTSWMELVQLRKIENERLVGGEKESRVNRRETRPSRERATFYTCTHALIPSVFRTCLEIDLPLNNHKNPCGWKTAESLDKCLPVG